ncbi:MAG: 2Fe-2S iron-sulfur cluster-binding protein [Thermoplasmata archaeon]|jgi:NADPH-dependent 2,4-dienoyl-CoA reductase/sulfur reductase-like enzyme/Pyruvate/2-oxoacid:ferredoxin oxidoreductase delta subunit
MTSDRVERHPILEVPKNPEMVTFTFDGQRLEARKSEMVSSALIANGIRIFGRHRRDGSPQGIFCANGQCAQCLVLADGLPVKACITPVHPEMDVRPIEGLPRLLADDAPMHPGRQIPEVETDVLIVGGGPAGLMAAVELGGKGVRCVLCDDKQVLGGKLSLQTHNFFGSVDDCYAGVRGTDIGRILEAQARAQKTVELWTDAPVVGVFEDGMVGVLKQGRFTVVRPQSMLVAAGAREKALAFAGADLPGVYGAGAFQTLVNRDLVKPSRRLFIVGGGNVGLIVAYQALQAGIDVVGLAEMLPECGGYKVHRDKILRLGVPVYTSHTVLRAEGTDRVERVIIARVDEHFRPIEGSEVAFEVDTVLVAVGLSSVNELYEEGRRLGMKVYSAGDAQEIAEASAAMFSGKIVARKILQDRGVPVEVPAEWLTIQAMLRSHPGPALGFYPPPSEMTVYPILRCAQEIPCNPCTDVCITDGITIAEGNLLGRPRLTGDCVGCLKCVAICPGCAITLVDKRHDPSGNLARVTVPWEMPEELVHVGDVVPTTGNEGEPVGTGQVLRILSGKSLNRRRLMVLEVPFADAEKVAGVRARAPESPAVPAFVPPVTDDEVIVCRCERITKQMIVDYLENTGTRDFNAVKAALRSGMGPCGGKTCAELTARIFRELGVDLKSVTPPVHRPFTQEVPMKAFLVESEGDRAV